MDVVSIVVVVFALLAIGFAISKSRKANSIVDDNDKLKSAKGILESRDIQTKNILKDTGISASTKLIKLKNLHGVE